MADHSVLLLRVALGIVFFWFGILKFFPDLSSAEELAARTISRLMPGDLPGRTSVLILAAWECLIGLGLVSGRFMRVTLVLLFLQLPGTILPLFMFPGETFSRAPFAPTLEGQYIIKNLVLIAAAIVLGATVRGGKVVADPQIAEKAKKAEEEKLERAKQEQ